jgi:hypothetical protein
MILDDRIPTYSCEDRERLLDSANQLLARGDWQMDSGSTYHHRIKKKVSPKCSVPSGDVFAYYNRVWNPDPTPENTFVPAREDSPWYISPLQMEDQRLDIGFQEHVVMKEATRKCLHSKHNLSALGLDGIGYCPLKKGQNPVIR